GLDAMRRVGDVLVTQNQPEPLVTGGLRRQRGVYLIRLDDRAVPGQGTVIVEDERAKDVLGVEDDRIARPAPLLDQLGGGPKVFLDPVVVLPREGWQLDGADEREAKARQRAGRH